MLEMVCEKKDRCKARDETWAEQTCRRALEVLARFLHRVNPRPTCLHKSPTLSWMRFLSERILRN